MGTCLDATLPVGYGGLGIRKALDLALPRYISSMFSVNNLVGAVLSRVINLASSEEPVAVTVSLTEIKIFVILYK